MSVVSPPHSVSAMTCDRAARVKLQKSMSATGVMIPEVVSPHAIEFAMVGSSFGSDSTFSHEMAHPAQQSSGQLADTSGSNSYDGGNGEGQEDDGYVDHPVSIYGPDR